MSRNFCEKCFRNFMAKQARNSAGSLPVFVDPRSMTFECKMPRFTSDSNGHPIVYVKDCETGNLQMYTQKEYERKRSAGEL